MLFLLGSDVMNMNVDYNYNDIESISTNIVKILLKNNISLEDIVRLSGKSEEEIKKIEKSELLGNLE